MDVKTLKILQLTITVNFLVSSRRNSKNKNIHPVESRLPVGILQIMVNPSLEPTRPDGSELHTCSYGCEGLLRVLWQYSFFLHFIDVYFPSTVKWSTQCIRKTHICSVDLDHHWLRYWLRVWSAPSHCLNQFWLIITYTRRNKLQWFLFKIYIFRLKENRSGNNVKNGGHFDSEHGLV